MAQATPSVSFTLILGLETRDDGDLEIVLEVQGRNGPVPVYSIDVDEGDHVEWRADPAAAIQKWLVSFTKPGPGPGPAHRGSPLEAGAGGGGEIYQIRSPADPTEPVATRVAAKKGGRTYQFAIAVLDDRGELHLKDPEIRVRGPVFQELDTSSE